MYKGRWECIRLRDAGSGQGYKTCPVDSGRSLDGEGRGLWRGDSGEGTGRAMPCRRLPVAVQQVKLGWVPQVIESI